MFILPSAFNCWTILLNAVPITLPPLWDAFSAATIVAIVSSILAPARLNALPVFFNAFKISSDVVGKLSATLLILSIISP